ncbi:hypothetical protein [Halodesulfovibrio marinisediminis]|uniref:Uncharacterized protein n=1 Tax=Halodesulfovibrio marinisediminis DSM 17456 TaxID=1121457 RepID=A0A1N6H5U9_9BACT|nr:hypothetical protein [Halodesulfovibrio marinisediminis]SIO15047.1 hypothetical protein SAMN02745161_2019 [Halodesulfovibrio marinisediminis DSM 17456]
MQKILFNLLLVLCLTGCMGSKTPLYGVHPKAKTAELTYTGIGIASDFELKNIATGTYKSIGHQSGVVYHTGAQNITLTINAAQKWKITATSRRQGFALPDAGIRLHNPYVGVVKCNGKIIGNIGISMPKVDTKREIFKQAGLNSLVNANLTLSGGAKILNKRYQLKSVYKDEKGEKHDSPLGYKVMSGKKTLGVVKVGENMFGGATMTVWITPGLSPVVEQSVVTILLLSGYAI